uniref:B30.2/SPRY domain-containing protein n=1 Tax=Sparus aurata TaxID=8175 RepID=A0A671Z2M2_SPAAU
MFSVISALSDLCFETLRGAVTRLKERLDEMMEELPEIRMKRMREHAVDLTFDPDTDGDIVQEVPNNPKRFETCSEVLAKEGFTTGKFYYEVQVTEKINWIIGVVRESVDRKENIPLSVHNGYWTIGLDEGIYKAYSTSTLKLTLTEELQKVGVFVDYDKGSVSLYNADSKSHIYSYTGYKFTEKMFPYFCLQSTKNGTNSAPLIISPIPQTHRVCSSKDHRELTWPLLIL